MAQDKMRGKWKSPNPPSVIPGWNAGGAVDSPALYEDENGEEWRLTAYDPADSLFPKDRDYHWRAQLTRNDNVYGEDAAIPAISGSESQFAAVAAIDVYAAAWKSRRGGGSGAILWLIALVAFVFTEKKRR